ncbi:MAG: PqqD family protein [Verrucomicrobiota bacterium]|nr:PqqD family protein [Verrucomicrobiota bacterium]
MPRYRINSPKVIHQIFDTEVVVVNLESGSYYSVEGSGIELWRLLSEGCASEEIIAAVAKNDASAAPSVASFLRESESEDLIVVEAESPTAPTKPRATVVSDFAASPPRLRKFTDMRDLLLLDPIHELDAAGWPQRGQATGSA